MEAITFKQPVKLPEEFTFHYTYRSFCDVEKKAERSPRAASVLSMLNDYGNTNVNDTKDCCTLVLIWKQYDSDFFGRRVDQIAREYKRRNPAHRVILLEIMHQQSYKDYESAAGSFHTNSDAALSHHTYKIKGYKRRWRRGQRLMLERKSNARTVEKLFSRE